MMMTSSIPNKETEKQFEDAIDAIHIGCSIPLQNYFTAKVMAATLSNPSHEHYKDDLAVWSHTIKERSK